MGHEIEKDYQVSKEKSNDSFLKLRIFISQNAGVLFGVLLMFILAKYGQNIFNFSSI